MHIFLFILTVIDIEYYEIHSFVNKNLCNKKVHKHLPTDFQLPERGSNLQQLG